jgi:hypothetical protein
VRSAGEPHSEPDVLIRFPVGCKLMIDSAVRLLSLANQLDFSDEYGWTFWRGNAAPWGT